MASSIFNMKFSLPIKAMICLLGLVPFSLFAQQVDDSLRAVPRLGEAVSAADVAKRDSLIFPDGTGLPSGAGDVATGGSLFSQKCVLCHGAQGRGGSAQELTGGRVDLTLEPPDQTIGTYWPHATTLFDFIRRAMPMHIPGSLSNDEAYALTAYLLHESGVIDESAILNAKSLQAIKMPNQDGFLWIDVTKEGKLKSKEQR